ncbi:YhbY family RNA-binding protein [Filifactor villosus]|uniref:YhbY family RNA-binding protein n=1 Tax=Filifactor villosus TaxID=29374 RepID=A0ABV9QML6_9FIRM
MITTKQRAKLRSLSNELEPVVIIGKERLTKEVIESIEKAIAKRELIKVKILDTAYLDTKETARKVSAMLHTEIVQCIGSKFVLFRQAKKDSKFKI